MGVKEADDEVRLGPAAHDGDPNRGCADGSAPSLFPWLFA
jgi:hypothetical protein